MSSSLFGLVVNLIAVTFLAMEQRTNNKYCFKLGKTPIETYEMLQTVRGDEAINRSSVSELFKDGREDFQDGPRSGRPSASGNADTIANFREMAT
jgi:hypothetical protein